MSYVAYAPPWSVIGPVHTSNNVECYKLNDSFDNVECCFDNVAGVDEALQTTRNTGRNRGTRPSAARPRMLPAAVDRLPERTLKGRVRVRERSQVTSFASLAAATDQRRADRKLSIRRQTAAPLTVASDPSQCTDACRYRPQFIFCL